MTILDTKGVITHKQVNLTTHAYERFLTRVEGNKTRDEAKSWFATALNNCTYITRQNDGNEVYVYKDHRIVIDKFLNVVTIMSHQESDYNKMKDTDSDIHNFIIHKLNKETKPLIQKRDNTQIQIYEKEISKIKVRNPKTKESIQNTIDNLTKELSLTNQKIEYVVKMAKKYYVKPEDVHSELKNY